MASSCAVACTMTTGTSECTPPHRQAGATNPPCGPAIVCLNLPGPGGRLRGAPSSCALWCVATATATATLSCSCRHALRSRRLSQPPSGSRGASSHHHDSKKKDTHAERGEGRGERASYVRGWWVGRREEWWWRVITPLRHGLRCGHSGSSN